MPAPENADHQLEPLRRLHAEYRRVGVSQAEIETQIKAEFQEYIAAHPEIRAQLETNPKHDPTAFAYAFSSELAFEVLATLPDGAGTAAYLTRYRERAGGWRWFERPDA